MAEPAAPAVDLRHLFDDVHFAVVPGGSIDDAKASEIRKEIEDHGGTHYALSSTDLRTITHLVACTHEFPAYDDAVDGLIHVVNPQWVEHSILRKRVANPRQYRPDPRFFLADVIVAIADDIPEGDKDAIIGGLQAMGGQYSSVMTRMVTHVVALTMENPQCQIIVTKRLSTLPVLPHWFDQCLMLGKKIDPTPYVLPDPPILRSDNVEADLNDRAKFSENVGKLKDAMRLEPTTLTPPTSPSIDRAQLSVFRFKAVMLASDLELAPHLRATITDLIRKGSGEVVDNIYQADTLICRYRKGLHFTEALDAGKDIGNLNWLYHLINTNKWSSPLRKLLHFPVPAKGIPGFKPYQISVSNYTGDARVYLESLVRACGATFTKTMTQNNTHLVTAHLLSEKVTAARDWNINIVSHLWLEESYAKCKPQAFTNSPRYTTFPSRTNLGEIIGQTQLDRKDLEELYLPHRKHKYSAETSSDARAMSPSKTPGPAKKQAVVTPAMNDKENLTPGSRGAKDRAIGKLQSMVQDMSLFQKELKRKGGVIYGGRRVTDSDRIALDRPSIQRKRSLSDEADDDETDDENAIDVDDGQRPKRKRISGSATRTRYVVTGGPQFGWSTAKSRRLAKLSIKEVETAPANGQFEVLVAPRLMRTPNFLAAVAAGATVVRPGWLEAMLSVSARVEPDAWTLYDAEGESEYGICLADVLRRAREHRKRGGMLHGMTIYCTEHVKGSLSAISDVVQRNGGSCVAYRGRETKPERARDRQADAVEGSDVVYLVSAPRDKGVWTKFRNMAKEQELTAKVVSADWLLQIAMSQDAQAWDDAWEWKEDEEA